MYILLILLFALIVTLIVLDAAKRINLMHPFFLVPALFIQINLIICIPLWHTLTEDYLNSTSAFFLTAITGLFLFYLWLRFHISPHQITANVSIRLRIMIGGRRITLYSLWMFTLECVFLIFCFSWIRAQLKTSTLIFALIYSIITLLFMFWNGLLRMFFTSKRLSIARRLIMILTMWIPVINFIIFLYACRVIRDEYDFALYKCDLRAIRAESDICRTKYPVIMVHGIFFRDIKYFNYWGRIPKELARYGTVIYYGNQEAVGTVAYNAEDIRKKIFEVMKETGSEKVNIIAHSKGGLDARHAITSLGMHEYVASLTTMNTPHRGCRFVDIAMKLPRPVINLVASAFNSAFHRFGDKNPDFYQAVMQFTTAYSREFNDAVPDAPGVYYQSYMSKMKSFFSDSILCIPYLFIKPLEGDNDGLVSVNSAKWGNYRGLTVSSGRRGISHGDIIDLKREDYRGFDVVEFYIQLLQDLKKNGY